MPPYVGLLNEHKKEFEPGASGYMRYDLSEYTFRVSPGATPHILNFVLAQGIVWRALSGWSGVPTYTAIFDDVIDGDPVSMAPFEKDARKRMAGDTIALRPGGLCFDMKHTAMGSKHEADERERLAHESELVDEHGIMRGALAAIANAHDKASAQIMRNIALDALAQIEGMK